MDVTHYVLAKILNAFLVSINLAMLQYLTLQYSQQQPLGDLLHSWGSLLRGLEL